MGDGGCFTKKGLDVRLSLIIGELKEVTAELQYKDPYLHKLFNKLFFTKDSQFCAYFHPI
jgi:hypothetical protein